MLLLWAYHGLAQSLSLRTILGLASSFSSNKTKIDIVTLNCPPLGIELGGGGSKEWHYLPQVNDQSLEEMAGSFSGKDTQTMPLNASNTAQTNVVS